jgi:hypothetical protein
MHWSFKHSAAEVVRLVATVFPDILNRIKVFLSGHALWDIWTRFLGPCMAS